MDTAALRNPSALPRGALARLGFVVGVASIGLSMAGEAGPPADLGAVTAMACPPGAIPGAASTLL